jgi:hypothetical protein
MGSPIGACSRQLGRRAGVLGWTGGSRTFTAWISTIFMELASEKDFSDHGLDRAAREN